MTIQTKAQPHDTVYYMLNNKVCNGVVDEIKILVQATGIGCDFETKYSIRHVNDKNFSPSQIFLSKEELLNSL
jgi:hypothetical protein